MASSVGAAYFMWQSKFQFAGLRKVRNSICNSLNGSGIQTVAKGYENNLTIVILKVPEACKRAAYMWPSQHLSYARTAWSW